MPIRVSRRPLSRCALLIAVAVGVQFGGCAGAAAPLRVEQREPEALRPSAETAAAPEMEPRFIEIIARAGDRPPGGDGLPISSIGIVTTDGAGRPAFAGTLGSDSKTETFVWQGSGIIWRSSEVTGPAPSNPAPLIGIGDDGQFVFQTAVDDVNAVWARPGLLLAAGQPAPGLDPGARILLNHWTTMTPQGVAHWISEFRDGPGQKGRGRVLYRSADATPGTIEVVLRADQEIEGLPIARPFGLEFSYQVSANGQHLVQILQRVTGSLGDDTAVYVDGTLPLIEGQPTGDGDHWERFLRVAVNDQGDTLVTGETDAANAKDAVLAYNGDVVLREGMTVAGRDLAAQAATLAVTLDNEGRAAHLWSVGGFGSEYLFFACDASDLASSVLLLRSKEKLTLEDPQAVMAVSRFNGVGHGPALSLGPGDRLFVEVELFDKLRPEGQQLGEAVLSVPLPGCPVVGEEPESLPQSGSVGASLSDGGQQPPLNR